MRVKKLGEIMEEPEDLEAAERSTKFSGCFTLK